MKKKILIVDDDPLTCEMLQTILTNVGYEVNHASSATKALALVEAVEFDLVLLDERLPELHGSELKPVLKKARPTMRIIYCTGVSSMPENGTPVIHKPFKIAQLLNIVRAALKEP